MLLIAIFRYLKSRFNKNPLEPKNFVSRIEDHARRGSNPSVEIVIPTRDKVEFLRSCIESVENATTYKNFRLLIIDNGSVEPATMQYLTELENRQIKVLRHPGKFNYSEICNLAASFASSEYLCFLNNDTEVINPLWLKLLVEHFENPHTGLVGSLMIYPDGKVQHAGVAMGYKGLAGHVLSGLDYSEIGKYEALSTCHETDAVTFACALVNRALYQALGGMNENFAVGLNDIDFAQRVHQAGLSVTLCSQSLLVHAESISRKSTTRSLSGALVALKEVLFFMRIWGFKELGKNEQWMRSPKK